jgi:CRISPR-associated protein (TIGR03986 family)
MNNKQYSNNEIRNTKTGWLTKKDDKWVIYNCHSDRVRMKSIAAKFQINNFKALSSVEKYISCNISNFDNKYNFEFDCEIPKTGKVYKLVDFNANKTGHLVMFGEMQNKKYEYIFESPNLHGACFELSSQDLIKRILAIESELDQSLWKFFMDRNIKSIPVFYKLDNSNKKVIHFGFSKLYKLNNTSFLKELEPLKSYFDEVKNQKKEDDTLDLANLIFGHTENNDALKGRVMIGHAISNNAIEQQIEEERVLGSPKPSFYPAYLNQDKNINQDQIKYYTYLNKDSVLRGFKRYPLHNSIKQGHVGDNQNILSRYKSLKTGTQFTCKIRFHNLKKIEIGALVSAITLHDSSNSFFNIGSAKPYGFGKIKIEIVNTTIDIQNALAHFEYQMNLHTNLKLNNKSNWIETKNIRELLALSKTASSQVDMQLVYPMLENNVESNQRKNQFNNVKKDKLSLKAFSELNGLSNTGSLLNQNNIPVIEKERIELNNNNKELAKAEAEKQAKIKAEKQAEQDEIVKEKAEQDALDAMHQKAANELAATQERNRIKREAEVKAILGEGLASLEGKDRFKDGKPILKKYLEIQNINTITDNVQLTNLMDFITRCAIKEKRNWKDFGKGDWYEIVKCVDNNIAMEWYNELKSKQ